MNENKISDSELKIINFLWTKFSGARIGEICRYLNDDLGKTWKQQTVRAFLTRLKDKGYVKTYIDKDTNRIVYMAAMSKDDYLVQESHKFVNEFFDGSLTKFVSAFSKQQDLTEEDTKCLKKMLEE